MVATGRDPPKASTPFVAEAINVAVGFLFLAAKNTKLIAMVSIARFPGLSSILSFHQSGELPYRANGVYNQWKHPFLALFVANKDTKGLFNCGFQVYINPMVDGGERSSHGAEKISIAPGSIQYSFV